MRRLRFLRVRRVTACGARECPSPVQVYVALMVYAWAVLPEYLYTPTYQYAAAGFAKVHDSVLELLCGEQSYVVDVGLAPLRTYRSRSGVQPRVPQLCVVAMSTLRAVWPVAPWIL